MRVFKQVVYAAKDWPDPQAGRREVWKIKKWFRNNPENWDARGYAFLKYQQAEMEAVVKFAKYRAMKRRYYD
eukprot:CAMPEP_0194771416 /NCGR_PEP_ID=MMETSP0323_2-20130528/49177_1 /TAXON_ID=2866 ORGANISM="Crypthecodinium cohnii, Strain Seligo" /NCGR_SAMPLE_ID=MMETSP0323_2 /ASSEMBLY_ACC=CAM_ASM_000346 /LENGTH=71 /DNA_ID=CAMNT_0039705503 /DNA_START=12 /DNA_END=227 /DNA_ORIENTATION=-